MKPEVIKARKEYKNALKHPDVYRNNRDKILEALVQNKTPKWGGLKVIIQPINTLC